MATGTIHQTGAVFFAFEAGAASITKQGYGVFDPVSSTVRIYLAARSTSDIATTTKLAGIPSAYRPASDITDVPIFFYAPQGSTPISINTGTIKSTGEIYQNAGSIVRTVYMVYEYKI